ncbi:hypothetical protein VPNG_04225 [Cytospora leucostoma]|uniref:Rhodopsin domain-containing protein n=1 Tax=Cytospora leucostoma TaxID=1230097 RepID=A0A423XDP4_9PEZI|nr:hypothetical protein VPNG_04225 [Cytospora leucostoma]
MAASVDPNARYVAPEGVALAIVIVSPTFLALSYLAVVTRAYVRITEKTFSIDDILLIGGLFSYTADVGLAMHAVAVGIGTVDSRLNVWMETEAMKYFTIWILVYVVGLALIKSSICTTIWRIANVRHCMRVTVYVLFGLVWASFLVTFIGMLLYCSPIQANWDTSLMKAQAKFEVFALMSVASLASLSTIARAPFITRYADPTDNLKYYVGFIVLFSNIESGIGCVATSLPAIRKLYMRLAKKEGTEDKDTSDTPKSNGSKSKTLVTIGGGGSPFASRGRLARGVNRGVSLTTVQARGAGDGDGDGDWEQLQDGDSDEIPLSPSKDGKGSRPLRGIRAEYTYSVELEAVGRDGSATR